MIKKICLVVLVLIAGFWGLAGRSLVVADLTDDQLAAKKKEVDELQAKLNEIQTQKQTLAQTINYLSTRILLTQKEVEKTEAEIAVTATQIAGLEGKINNLEVNLDNRAVILKKRVNVSYIKTSAYKPLLMILDSQGIINFLRNYQYLRISEHNDRESMIQLETARTNYDKQKQIKEAKQQELASLQTKLQNQKTSLDKQQKDKQAALTVTRNDEKHYQDQLAAALAEIQAIQSIVAGGGQESKVGGVNEGDAIASVISGPSACSSGSHLHFEVAKDKINQNPANYLTNKNIIWDDGPDGAFGLNGSWRWPVDDPIRVTQGYGMTFYAATLHYYGGKPHTGIDMISDNGGFKVMAVKPGTLYRGAIACGKGVLRYVRVDQGDGLSTYYLHVNY